MALFVLLIGVVGAARPQTLTWVGPYVGWLLGVVMFGMGMTLTFQDFKRVLHRPWEVLLGVVAQFLIMPLAAWFLVWLFALPAELMHTSFRPWRLFKSCLRRLWLARRK